MINGNNTREDTFVHLAAITQNNPHKVKWNVGEGESAQFDVVVGEKGQEVSNMTIPGGKAVQGSSYATDRRRLCSH